VAFKASSARLHSSEQVVLWLTLLMNLLFVAIQLLTLWGLQEFVKTAWNSIVSDSSQLDELGPKIIHWMSSGNYCLLALAAVSCFARATRDLARLLSRD